MTEPQRDRLDMLRRQPPCVPDDYLLDYYGLRFGDAARRLYDRWRGTIRNGDRCGRDADRVLLELFLQQQKMTSHRWAGASLGMREDGLRELLARREELGLVPVYEYAGELVLEAFKEDLLRAIPSLRFRTFANHSDLCRRLHEALATGFGIRVDALPCDTSEQLGETPPLYASFFDCLTLQPVSAKHSIWLNLGKPISLPPDRCSRLFFARNRGALDFATAGMGGPGDLEVYEQAAQGA